MKGASRMYNEAPNGLPSKRSELIDAITIVVFVRSFFPEANPSLDFVVEALAVVVTYLALHLYDKTMK